CRRLASPRASLGMIPIKKVSSLTILHFKTMVFMLVSYAAATDQLHWVRCSFSCLTTSSIDRVRTEKPQKAHFDSTKKTWFRTTGFRLNSYSSNSILHSLYIAPVHYP